MDGIQPVIDFLLKLGLTPLEIITLIAVVVLYGDNRMLFDRLTKAETTLEDCVKKVPPGGPGN